jgi:hypothetical protein
MAATIFVCAAVSMSQASAYPSGVTVAPPATDVRASRANITIFPAMNGIPAVGTGGTMDYP